MIWYPILSATALFCAQPVIEQGTVGIPEAFGRLGAAFVAILLDPTSAP